MGGGGGLDHLPSFLFSDREGLDIRSIHIPSSSGKGNGCDNGQISCSPLDKGGLVVVVMAIYHTFLFGGREVVVVPLSFSGIGNGCDHGQIPCSPSDNGVW